ncbi:MAG: glycosyltransferase family 4 protein [Methanoregula sp.]|nr:glycosyltransferase family 4 protein [Methanoregula sp.]
MKILFINYECPPLGGGGGVASFQLAQELAKRHDVDYLTSGFGNLPEYEMLNGVQIYRVPVINRKELSTATFTSMLSFAPAGFLKGIVLCKKKKYDCVHALFVVPSGICGWGLSRLFQIPLVLTALGGDVYDPSKKHSPHTSRVLKFLITFLFNHSDRSTVESENLSELILQYYKPQKPVNIIPLGFLKPLFTQKSRTELQIPEDRTILISVGRLVGRKGYEYAIHALSTLPATSFHYYIIGEGPKEADLKNLAIRLGLENNITFLGYVPDEMKFQYLAVSDIFLLPSVHEGFGICLLEAMHCGLPIVSTNNGGQTDILKDRINALLVSGNDSDAFAGRIKELMLDETLRKNISINNRRDIDHYYIEEIASEYETLYKDLIKTQSNEGLHENR